MTTGSVDMLDSLNKFCRGQRMDPICEFLVNKLWTQDCDIA